MRNNVLIWLTGWSFSTFNSFHRWVARIATVEAALHGISYTVEGFLDGGKAEYIENWSEQYWRMGVIAVISMSFLCIFSIYPMRRYKYELFLLLHLAFAVLCIGTLWYHVAIFDGQYNPYIWPCVAVWVLDRVLRLCRLGLLNLSKLQATIRYNKDADIIHLTVPVRGISRPRAGSYYFLYSLNGLKFWESHPFTLMSWSEVGAQNTKQAALELSFLVRPQDGFTARLRDHVSQKSCSYNESGTSQVSIRMAVEGPYGHTFGLSHYQNVLMVVGGTGVTVALSHLCMIRDIAAANKNPAFSIRRVQLDWVVRDSYMFEDIYENELLPLWSSRVFSGDIGLEIHIYVVEDGSTTPLSATDRDTKMNRFSSKIISDGCMDDTGKTMSSSDTQCDTGSTPKITLSRGRPAVQRLVQERAEESHVNEQKMAVICCGPGSMMDDARAGVVCSMVNGFDEIDFFPESFRW
ncbi:ferric reductase like transmembrane component-domain-containing protein [Talaromyces proteolyticus]|uniref:Ferric reductase like transmembrane component-domain-containing protein n=1 Tax=Talaromyces proteolyticus TaxID=1131652 RepID=A0AAD4KF67_9EURO|nr:ferric reductase like transmembrane component-domain-containing protein [Talaromyces proteolyticus]KAH8690570.1 ferric reductase like transmembrane component-domain-containing protein [Talaromyces proteolyticus]